MKVGQMLVCFMTSISNMFLVQFIKFNLYEKNSPIKCNDVFYEENRKKHSYVC